MALCVFYLGGNAGKSNTGVHDIPFVVARHPEEARSARRKSWFGNAYNVHIEGYGKPMWADGHLITFC
ncbi:DUF1543 domain-containing protein [Pantoea sp. AS142]|uniref:DUF1543 domain-containing protein n=1 Tax=Pantoea sp. AS142 TaxID=3081292 RepID=UPI0030190D17